MKTVGEISSRVGELRSNVDLSRRARIRDVMNGGAAGVRAILAWNKEYVRDLGDDLTAANMMLSGMERMAQKIGRIPTLKTDMIPTADTATAREKSEKRARIVTGWDDTSRFELQFPQIGRWLPGYGITGHVIRERQFGTETYPVAELRDAYSLYPGQWGVDQQPEELAAVRMVSLKSLLRIYPQLVEVFQRKYANRPQATNFGYGYGSTVAEGGWEGRAPDTVEVVEYMDIDGTHIYIPTANMVVSFIPNPLKSGPAFVMTKRFSFDETIGQYDHGYGLMMMMAKLNILGLMGVEDSNFRETNIIGEMVGDTYERGRKAVNIFEPGTRIEKPTSDQLNQTWQAINILERQFRQVAGYAVSDDGQSPNSFATGQGIRELGASADYNVREYQTAIKHSVELIDMKRLEWEEAMHPKKSKKVYWYEGGNQFEEHYTPEKDIAKDYRTKRVYGAMATFDENSKVITGLQLLQAKIIDRRTLQENLDGLDNVSLINERIDADQAKEMLIGSLGNRAAQGDPAADMALIKIMDKPGSAIKTLKKLFTPEEPQMSPEEMAMAQGMGQPGMGQPGMGGGGTDPLQGGPPPAVQTILSQMEAPGGVAMSVGQM